MDPAMMEADIRGSLSLVLEKWQRLLQSNGPKLGHMSVDVPGHSAENPILIKTEAAEELGVTGDGVISRTTQANPRTAQSQALSKRRPHGRSRRSKHALKTGTTHKGKVSMRLPLRKQNARNSRRVPETNPGIDSDAAKNSDWSCVLQSIYTDNFANDVYIDGYSVNVRFDDNTRKLSFTRQDTASVQPIKVFKADILVPLIVDPVDIEVFETSARSRFLSLKSIGGETGDITKTLGMQFGQLKHKKHLVEILNKVKGSNMATLDLESKYVKLDFEARMAQARTASFVGQTLDGSRL